MIRKTKSVKLQYEKQRSKIVPVGSLLMVVRGMILAHSFPVALTTREVTINQDMKALLLPDGIREYLLLYMRAMRDTFVAMVDRSSHGTCKLVSEKLSGNKDRYSPFSEQHRICAKVDELMAICGSAQIPHCRSPDRLQRKLADALVRTGRGLNRFTGNESRSCLSPCGLSLTSDPPVLPAGRLRYAWPWHPGLRFSCQVPRTPVTGLAPVTWPAAGLEAHALVQPAFVWRSSSARFSLGGLMMPAAS